MGRAVNGAHAIRHPVFSFPACALAVTGVLGYLSGFVGPWTVVLVILVMIPVTIEVGRKVLKRDQL